MYRSTRADRCRVFSKLSDGPEGGRGRVDGFRGSRGAGPLATREKILRRILIIISSAKKEYEDGSVQQASEAQGGRRVNPARISAADGTKIAGRRVRLHAARQCRRAGTPRAPGRLSAATSNITIECIASKRRTTSNLKMLKFPSGEAERESISVVRFSWLTSGQIVIQISFGPLQPAVVDICLAFKT
ncbi:hypothetical protein ACJJTC_011987 [Scirpophaga incertulas]